MFPAVWEQRAKLPRLPGKLSQLLPWLPNTPSLGAEAAPDGISDVRGASVTQE